MRKSFRQKYEIFLSRPHLISPVEEAAVHPNASPSLLPSGHASLSSVKQSSNGRHIINTRGRILLFLSPLLQTKWVGR